MRRSLLSDNSVPPPGVPAFTLVELLVVIGIIGVLIAILVPTLNKARRQAKEVACMSNLRQWGMGFIMYADRNRGRMPNDGEDGVYNQPVGDWSDPALWFNAVPPLLGAKPYSQLQDRALLPGGIPLPKGTDNTLFACPSAPDAVGVSSDIVTDGYFRIWGTSAGAKQDRSTFLCYVTNSKMNPNAVRGYKLSSLRPASDCVLLVEKRMAPGELLRSDEYYDKTLARLKADWQRFAARHRNGGYLCFADGHVAFFTNAEIARPPYAKTQNPNNWNQPGKAVWRYSGPVN